MELSGLLQRAEDSGLDNALLTGILLDYRDQLKMSGNAPEIPAVFK